MTMETMAWLILGVIVVLWVGVVWHIYKWSKGSKGEELETGVNEAMAEYNHSLYELMLELEIEYKGKPRILKAIAAVKAGCENK